MQTLPWLDTGIAGIEIKIAEFVGRSDGVQAVLVQSGGPLPQEVVQHLSGIGFQPFGKDGRRMARRGNSFVMREMLGAFPDARATDVDASSILIRFEPAPKAQASEPARAPVAASPAPSPTAGESVPTPPVTPPAASAPRRPFGSAQGFRPKPAAAVAAPPVRAASAVESTSAPSDVAAVRPEAPAAATKPATAFGGGRFMNKVVAPDRKILATETFSGERVNRFQVKYRPGSVLGTPIAMIPVNLAAPTEIALDRVRETYGDIDAFVAGRLDWTIERMAELLSPEQIDAVALEIAAMDRGQAFILADQTGLGKGRVVAAVARAAVIAGKIPVVITEKENLFSDLFRDVKDIDSLELLGRPFMLNDGAQITDVSSVDREVIHPAWKKQEVQEVLKSAQLPPGIRMVLSTYSQFNKRGSVKSEFLKKISRGQHLICDESHNAVGDSATSENLADAMDVASSVMYSSATFARNAKNLAAYKRLFPASMRSSDLMGVLSAGGQAISEALSQMLAEDGVYLRREQDLSGISIKVIDDRKRIDRNRAYADALSPILAEIGRLSRAVQEIAEERNTGGTDKDEYGGSRKAGKEQWYTGNFGARLSVVVRQFVTALLVDLAVEECVETLEAGEKPVVVIESTMESLMRELASDEGIEEPLVGGDGEAVIDDVALEEGAEPSAPKPPDFRDALRLMLERTMMLMVKTPGADEADKIPVDDPELVAAADQLRQRIDAFPDLPLSPIDDIRDRVEAIGRTKHPEKPWRVDEISARGMRVVDGVYEKMPSQDRVGTVAAFNAGNSDAILLTRAASTGLSLHSSERVNDRRPRRMIELQIPRNVVERVQFWGRVNRRGQVNIPSFATLSTALELQTRELAIQNRKVADLSANVTASAESASAMDVPDMIDAVGNAVCKRLLEERPSVADRMQIALKLQDMEKAEGELYHVHKFLQRLVLLPAREQQQLYREALAAYSDAVKEMAARGRHPRGARELEGEWRVVSSELFEPGDRNDGPIFGRNVTSTVIESMQALHPWTSTQVREAAEAAMKKVERYEGAQPMDPFAGYIAAIGSVRAKVLSAALSKHYINVRQALADSRPNAVKDASSRLDLLLAFLRTARPGFLLELKGEEGREEGVIVDIRPPIEMKDAHHPGRWAIRYIVPGDESPREISAATIIRDPTSHMTATPKGIPPNVLKRFDIAPRGETLVRRRILDGNLVRAVVAARNAGWGSTATWTDATGIPHRAILVPKNKQDTLHFLPGRCTDPELAIALLQEGAVLFTNPDSPDTGASIVLNGGQIVVEVPGSKRITKLFETDAILEIVGAYRGDHRQKSASVPASRMAQLCRAFADAGHAFHYKGDFRPRVAEMLEQMADDVSHGAPAM